MTTKHRNHMIMAEAANVTTWCGKRSAGGGIGTQVLHFAGDEIQVPNGALREACLLADEYD